MAKKSEATDVAKKEPTGALVVAEMEDIFAQDQGVGLDEVVKDIALPFISVLQALSPQINKRKEQYIEGAEAGMMFNTVTSQLYDGEMGVDMISCFYEKVVNEWIPRDSGGGYVATHADMDEAKANAQPGNQLVETANYYVLVRNVETDAWEPAVLSMTSTKLKISRRWNSLMNMLKVNIKGQRVTPPLQGTIWHFTTVEQTNDKGTFFNLRVEFKSMVPNPELYASAKEFGDMAAKGLRRVNYNADPSATGEASSEDEGEDDDPTF